MASPQAFELEEEREEPKAVEFCPTTLGNDEFLRDFLM